MGENFDNPWGLKFKRGKIKKMSGILNSAVFPGMQGGPLEHVIAAKAVAFEEALTEDFLHYQVQVKTNAEAMAQAFVDKGYKLISGGTDNHMMLIDLRNKNITGKQAENALEKAHITVNKNMVPFDTESPFITSGIRVGTAAITTRGLKEKHMNKVVNLIDSVIQNFEDEKALKKIGKKVKKMMKNYGVYA